MRKTTAGGSTLKLRTRLRRRASRLADSASSVSTRQRCGTGGEALRPKPRTIPPTNSRLARPCVTEARGKERTHRPSAQHQRKHSRRCLCHRSGEPREWRPPGAWRKSRMDTAVDGEKDIERERGENERQRERERERQRRAAHLTLVITSRQLAASSSACAVHANYSVVC